MATSPNITKSNSGLIGTSSAGSGYPLPPLTPGLTSPHANNLSGSLFSIPSTTASRTGASGYMVPAGSSSNIMASAPAPAELLYEMGVGGPNPNPMLPVGAMLPERSRSYWQHFCLRVMPLFDGEELKVPVEELNELLSGHLAETSIESVLDDIRELLAQGMSKLVDEFETTAKEDNQLFMRMVEIWSFFFFNILPYLQGALLPIRRFEGIPNEKKAIREMILYAFRDFVVIPMRTPLEESFGVLSQEIADGTARRLQTALKLLQMLNILDTLPPRNDDMDGVLSGVCVTLRTLVSKAM
ncbi:HbrB-like-domain-containing protein [Polychytrium aggregatum]|uniref:HbrB-like-domain-containing protein n=1 Tax=Polychytrium aggregatum TaxID=110093 RepID=UPI0022FDCEF8|nr:HbrB-like-domain-containing protein [Polychytrium aggregatum]KAI9208074.1 HbrB-like-domain-containing protein [Polychytrium aggregatum]